MFKPYLNEDSHATLHQKVILCLEFLPFASQTIFAVAEDRHCISVLPVFCYYKVVENGSKLGNPLNKIVGVQQEPISSRILYIS